MLEKKHPLKLRVFKIDRIKFVKDGTL